MRVAFIVDGFPRFSETFILNQIVGLLDRGHDVRIFAAELGGDSHLHPEYRRYNLPARAVSFGIPDNLLLRFTGAARLILRHAVSHPAAVAGSLNVIRHGRHALNLRLIHWLAPFLDERFDIIHCHFGPNGVIGVLLRQLGVPGKIITSFHGYDVGEIPRRYGRDVYGRLFAEGDLFTANTRFTLGCMTGLGCPADKSVILPMSIDLGRYAFSERTAPPEGTLNLVSVARLVEKKGLRYAIEAVSMLRAQIPGIRYRIIGEGPMRSELEALVRKLDLQDAVELPGAKTQDEIRAVFAGSHLCLMPSVTDTNGDQEGQGVVLQEAQASGLPVIATRHNGFPEGMDENRSGFLVPEHDAGALAERIEYLARNTDLWPAMSREGRAFVEEKYDLKKLAFRLERIYEAALANDSGLLDSLRNDY